MQNKSVEFTVTENVNIPLYQQSTLMQSYFCSSISALLFLSFLLISHFDIDLYLLLGKEGVYFERFTSIFYLLAGILCIWSVFGLYFFSKSEKSIKHNIFGMLWLSLIGCFFIFVAGEEESWGQWLFGYATPKEIQNHNLQKEFNLHNLRELNSLLDTHTILNLIAVIFGIILPFINKIKLLKKFLFSRNIIAPPIYGIYFFISGLLYEKTANIMNHSWINTEYTEFFFSVGFFAFSFEVFQAHRTKSWQKRSNNLIK